ncbi:hypothetical protein CVT26_001353 [Gymnopilus dilepis]|uniref:Uncharacterized protein n=1 Tax=Gymnopilus dilepis TaxID=231916 RepID=A0A409WBH1_9AGAR|nr:hypothetical protein CVT26_001353 [Gymnopilus dilepis]
MTNESSATSPPILPSPAPSSGSVSQPAVCLPESFPEKSSPVTYPTTVVDDHTTNGQAELSSSSPPPMLSPSTSLGDQADNSIQAKTQLLPPLVIKPSMMLRSPFAHRERASVALFKEKEKSKKIYHVRSTSRRRAIAEERLSKQVFKETKLLDMAQSNGQKWNLQAPGLALAVAIAAKKTVAAERDAMLLQVEEGIEQLQFWRQAAEELESLLDEAEAQVQYLRTLYQEHGILEEDLDIPEVEEPETPPSSPPLPDSPVHQYSLHLRSADQNDVESEGSSSGSGSSSPSSSRGSASFSDDSVSSDESAASSYKSAHSQPRSLNPVPSN